MRKLFTILFIIICVSSFGQAGNSYLNKVANMSALTTLKGVTGTRTMVEGFYAPYDGGGGEFYWDDTATRAVVNGWNIKVTGVTTGEWQRVYNGQPLNVRWFGAHGDGTTDDRAIVQGVINFAPYIPIAVTQGYPVAVYLPTGAYWMSCNIGANTTLNIPPGTEIFGDGDNSVIQRKNTGNDTVGYTITLQQTLSADSSKNNYSLHDFKIIGATRGIYAGHPFGNTSAGDGGIFLILNNTKAHTNKVEIYNVTVYSVSAEAIGAWGYAYLTAHNNKVINANFDAYNFVGRTTMFQNNYADSVNVVMEYRGAYSYPITNSDSSTYALFENNTATNVFEYAYYLEGGNRIKILGSQIIGAGNYPVSISSQSIGIYIGPIPSSAMGIKGPVGIDLLEIEHNHIDNFVQTGIGTSNPQLTDGVVTNLKIIDNTVSNSGGIAIQLQAADTLHFTHTILNDNLIYGWNRIQTSSSVVFSALYIQNIKNISIENNRILNSNPSSARYDPMFIQGTDSLIFQDNNCWGRTANLVIQTGGTNINTFICNNYGLDPVLYPPCTVASVSIGQAIGSGTSGSILYVDGSIDLAQDNANLFYNATNKQLGIGTNSLVDTKVGVEVHGLYNGFVGTVRAVTTDAFSINKGGSLALGGRVDGSSVTTTFGAIIAAKANTTSGNGASYLSFETRSTGSSTTSEAMRIDSNQHLLIGTATSNNAFLTIAPNTTDFASIFLYGSLVNPGTLSDGMLWYNGSADALYFRHNSTTTNLLAGGGGGVSSVSGTANRITSTGGTTPVIDISASYVGQSSITTLGTIGTGVWNGTLVAGQYGGTGVANTGKTITLGGNLTTSGAFASTFTMTNTTAVTFPTSGTLTTTATRLDQFAAPNTDVSWASNKITTLLDPTSAQDAATKNYVDNAISGTDFKDACNYSSTAALPTVVYSNSSSGVGATLTGAGVGALSLDGNSPIVGNRVLIKNQVDQTQNGIYTVTATGSGIAVFVMTRTTDFNQTSNIKAGDATYIISGTVNTGTTWVMTTTGTITVGSSNIVFAQVSGPGVGVSTVSGTTNRITSTGGANPVIDISSTFEALLGKVANPLSQFASTTSSQLAGVISNETGSGSLVFGTAPSMSSITLAAGTASAGTGPLYFTPTSSVLLTSAVAGSMQIDANGIPYYTHATSEIGVVDAEQFIALSGAYTLTNNTSAQKIFDATTNGQITLASSKTYFFECFFTMTNLPGSSGGVSFTLGGTATFTSIEMFSTGLRSANLANVGTAQTAFVATNTIATVTTVGTAATQVCKVTGMIRVNAGGTVIPQVTMTTASTAAIVGANSYFRLVPIGTNTVTNIGNWN